jgi:CHAT domain-containing protein/tetratricopeptide (TPR) repeat protein
MRSSRLKLWPAAVTLLLAICCTAAANAQQSLSFDLAQGRAVKVASPAEGVRRSAAALKVNHLSDAENLVLGALEAWNRSNGSQPALTLVLEQMHATASRYRAFGESKKLTQLNQRAIDMCMAVLNARSPMLEIGSPEVECVALIADALAHEPALTGKVDSLFESLLQRPAPNSVRAKLRNEYAVALSSAGRTGEAITELEQAEELLTGNEDARSRAEVVARLGILLADSGATMFRGLATMKRALTLIPPGEEVALVRFRAVIKFQIAVTSFTTGAETTDEEIEDAFAAALTEISHVGSSDQEVREMGKALRGMRALHLFRIAGRHSDGEAGCLAFLADPMQATKYAELVAKCDFFIGQSAQERGEIGVARLHYAAAASDAESSSDPGVVSVQLEAMIRLARLSAVAGQLDESIVTLRNAGKILRAKVARSVAGQDRYDRAESLWLFSGWQKVVFGIVFDERISSKRSAQLLAMEAVLTTTSVFSDLSRRPAPTAKTARSMLELAQARADFTAYLSSGADFTLLDLAADRVRKLEAQRDALTPSVALSFGDADTVSAALKSGEQLLNYVYYEPYSATTDSYGSGRYGVVAVGTDHELVMKDLGPARQIDDLIDNYQAAIRRQRIRGWDEAALARIGGFLRESLLDPVFGKGPRPKRLYIVPVGGLVAWPFETAPEPAVGPTRYLVESSGVVYLQSARQLYERKSTLPVSSSTLLIADPDFDFEADTEGLYPKVSRLPTTQQFINGLAARFASAGLTAQPIVGRAATEGSVFGIGEAPRVAVFATHGYYDPERASHLKMTLSELTIGGPNSGLFKLIGKSFVGVYDQINPLLNNGLLLAGANGAPKAGSTIGDGRLSAYELETVNFHGTELVLFTACQSGLGTIQSSTHAKYSLSQPSGEIVAGLRQAAFVAGAQSVVASLWDVPVKASTIQMDDFISGWMKGRGRYESFRAAQLAQIARARARPTGGAHPIEWAGFVYLGNPGDH